MASRQKISYASSMRLRKNHRKKYPAKNSSASITKVKRWKSYGYMMINTLSWGAALIIVKPAFDVTTPFRFLFYRFLFASILVLPLIWKYCHQIPQLKSKLMRIVPLEILGTTLSLSLLYAGLAATGAIEASLISTTTPIWIVIGGVLLLKEKEEINEILGLILAVIGTLLLTLFPIFNGYTLSGELSITGNVLVLLSVLTVAIYYVLAKKYYQNMPKMFVTSVSFIIGMITIFPLVLWETWSAENSLVSLMLTIWNDLKQPSVLIAALYMATFGSVIGLTAYIKGQNEIEASEAALFTYLQPLIYLPLGFFMLGEKVYAVQILALIVIFIGVMVAEKRIDHTPHRRAK